MNETIRRAIHEIVDDVDIFHFLKKDEAEILIPYLELREYARGEILFREGDPGDFICFICSGKMEVKKETQFKGKQVILAVLSKGSFAGELSFMDGQARSATVVAIEDSRTLILRYNKFDAFLDDHPRIGVKLLRGTARILGLRLREADKRLAAIF